MINKFIFLTCSLYLPLALGSQAPDTIMPATQNNAVAPVAVGSKLDVVTTIKPIQDIIAGYLCNHEHYTFLHEIETNKDIKAVALAPDNQTIAAVRTGYGKDIRFWNLLTGQRLHQIEINLAIGEDSIIYSPDNTYIVACHEGPESPLHFFDPISGKEIRTSVAEQTKINAAKNNVALSTPLAFIASGTKLLVLGNHSDRYGISVNQFRIVEINLNDGSLTFLRNNDKMRCCAVSHDKQTILVGCEEYIEVINCADNTSKKIDLHEHIPTAQDKHLWVWNIVFSPDGKKYAAAILQNGKPEFFILIGSLISNCPPTLLIDPRFDEVKKLMFSPDNCYVFYTFADSDRYTYFRRYNLLTNKDEDFPVKTPGITHINFSQNGKYLALTSCDRTIKLYATTAKLLTDKVQITK